MNVRSLDFDYFLLRLVQVACPLRGLLFAEALPEQVACRVRLSLKSAFASRENGFSTDMKSLP